MIYEYFSQESLVWEALKSSWFRSLVVISGVSSSLKYIIEHKITQHKSVTIMINDEYLQGSSYNSYQSGGIL